MVYLKIPGSIQKEHEEMMAELSRAGGEGGQIGRAADAVEGVLRPHLRKEEEFALPPLGLLAPLAAGEPLGELEPVLAMTEKMRRELPAMISDHRDIARALQGFDDALKAERRQGYAQFPERLQNHARMEEEVLYPASILVGDLVRMRLRI